MENRAGDAEPQVPRIATLFGSPLAAADEAASGLGQIIAEHALEFCDQPYIEVDRRGVETSASVRALYVRATAVLETLRTVGDLNTPVVICVQSVLDYVPTAWACVFGGRTFLAWSHREGATADQPKVNLIANKLTAPILVTTRDVHARLGSRCESIFAATLFLDDHPLLDDASAADLDLLPPADITQDVCQRNPASVLTLTSGTSGTPKLVEIPHEHFRNRWYQRVADLEGGSRLSPRPFDTASGVLGHLVVVANGGFHLDPERAFADPRGLLRQVEKRRIATIAAPNSLFANLVDALDENEMDVDLSCLRRICIAGEMISPDLPVRIREHLAKMGASEVTVTLTYGSSELGAITSSSEAKGSVANAASGAVSNGPCRTGACVRIVDADGEIVGLNQVGLIEAMNSSCTFTRYFGDERATAAAFTNDGWFKTQDMGLIDDHGLTVVGRQIGMLIANGRSISLAQIERCLIGMVGISGHLFAAAPVRTPDNATEELAIFFVPSLSARETIDVVASRIRRQVATSVGVAAKHVVALSEQDFARNRSGKINRRSLVSGFDSGKWASISPATFGTGMAAAEAASATTDATWLENHWCKVLDSDSANAPDANFFDHGGDSLKFAELVVAIESHFSCQIPIQQFFEDPTLSTLTSLVERAQLEHSADSDTSKADFQASEVIRRIESMVATWSGDRSFEDSLVVGKHLGGVRPPIFWACQSHYEFATLADALGDDQPLYGLRSLNQIVKVGDVTADVLEAVTYRYLAEVMSLRLPGPLVIGGNCSGGIIALALARKLRRYGSEPAPLMLLNWQFNFGRYEGPVVIMQGMNGADEFALTDTTGRKLDWAADFPEARPTVLPGRHAHYFSGAPLEAFAAILREQTEGAHAR